MKAVRARVLWQFVVIWLAAFGAAVAQPVGPTGNLPLPPDALARRLRDDLFEITAVKAAGGGVMGAKKLHLAFADGVGVDVKWKTSPAGGEGWNNSPRREVAAYAVQEFFLDPDDYLIPPTVSRCIPFDTFRPVDPQPTATFEGSRCVFGTFAAWLSNVVEPPNVFDPARFSTDRRYAYHFANLNLLTYLIDHRDARQNNFLMSKENTNPQVFSIDNGIAFGGVLYNFFMSHLDQLRVDALPQQSIDRLRAMTPDDWQRLGVVEQLHLDSDGVLRPVPSTAPLNSTKGTRWVAGTLQLGLTSDEINAIVERATTLLLDVEHGHITPF